MRQRKGKLSIAYHDLGRLSIKRAECRTSGRLGDKPSISAENLNVAVWRSSETRQDVVMSLKVKKFQKSGDMSIWWILGTYILTL